MAVQHGGLRGRGPAPYVDIKGSFDCLNILMNNYIPSVGALRCFVRPQPEKIDGQENVCSLSGCVTLLFNVDSNYPGKGERCFWKGEKN